ncbi:hypothetical protein EDD90_1593 [Streptomyces sp. Ag109_O5-1]|uniref:hypothetical protein n=1 Tax=Streptomyces sp. Ag109_O5-1 TaxID=1938851 RepID=UPI000F50903E|nr:hypothetical protein [Streptomyces sp. Ag109_O5-1]RPE38673.1 hypothetical protein EDD90_1593 [Streptomyces sp. Ag109_O5-1]
MELPLQRRGEVHEDMVFFAMPYQNKTLPNGKEVKFDVLYRYFKRWVDAWGLKGERADEMPDTTWSPLDAAWSGVDQAGVVVVDLSAPSTSVAMELGWAMCLNKRLVVIAHHGADLPTNVVGQLRVQTYSDDLAGLDEFEPKFKREIEVARERLTPEMGLQKLTLGRALARVTVEEVSSDYIRVCDERDHRRIAKMFKSDMSYDDSIPDHMSKKFRTGESITGYFITRDGVQVFTQRESEENPWATWERAYRRGQTYTARVTDANYNGVFIELLPEGGKSRLKSHEILGREFKKFDEVEVAIGWVDRERQRIDVSIVDHSTPLPTEPPRGEYPRQGDKGIGTVVDMHDNRIYVRVKFEEYPRYAILHRSMMREALQQELASGAILVGRKIPVRVAAILRSARNPRQWDVRLEELAESEVPLRLEANGESQDGAPALDEAAEA